MRRLLVLASTMVLFDVAFYSAIAPLLPNYVSDLGLSRAEAGVLSAAYAAGALAASLPAGLLASRAGPRRTVLGGLALIGASSFVFGFAHQIALLDVARFSQGVGGALVWSGAMTWLTASSPPERRGSLLGTVMGTAVAGALIGPALGALAAEVGTEAVFGAVVGIAAGFAFFAWRTPDAVAHDRQGLAEVGAAVATRPVITAVAFVAIPSVLFGATEVIVPLRVNSLGGSNALIAAGFIVAAGVEASTAPLAGRLSDRVGRVAPLAAGLTVAAVAMVAIGFVSLDTTVLAALVLSSLGGGLCLTPALALLSETAEAAKIHQGFSAGLSNMAWALGQVSGGLVGGGLAGAAGFATPCVAVAALLFGTAVYARRGMLGSDAPTAVA
jgi:MFS family permease